ncbi:MAG: hypothetical protein WBA10_11955 [Elainellaceae cyanobacterium]
MPFFQRLRSSVYLIWTLTPSPDPKIHSKLTQSGSLQFDVYDPVTHQHCSHFSEESLRSWLEQRYYISPRVR